MPARFPARAPDSAKAGIGLRTPHFEALAARRPALSFLEVHSENYFADGGPSIAWLERFRADYAVSLHGVGLSLGSVDPLDGPHLSRLARLVKRIEPALVSEHLCWSSLGGRHLNELLPLPYSEEVLAHVCGRVAEVQDRLGRTVLIENVSAYVRFTSSTIPEGEFVAEVARRTGCGVLLDVNNAWVNAVNHGTDARQFLGAIDPATVGEIHLAGCEVTPDGLIDTHGAPVFPEVWALFEETIARLGPVPTLIEWDNHIPELDVLLAEAGRADAILGSSIARTGRRAAA
ncbi:MAG: DUF692 domain-containing protein [Betaproteobacteria bacterium]|nr:DUF692 domain-containing protein [Betaproteobacteria bacterium]